MKKRVRNLTAIVLVVVMIVSIIPFGAISIDAAEVEEKSVGATQKAMFIMDTVNISQGMYEGTHQGSKAIDFAGRDGGIDPAYAPFDGKVVYISISAAYIVYQSLNPVEFADGTVDYMTVWVIHDDDVGRFYVGQTFLQGQHFFNEGSSGYATGNHIHLECARGTYQGQYQNDYGWWCINNQINPYDALYLSESTTIINGYGYNWRRTNGSIGVDVSTPTISFDKSSYTIGETARITWDASPSESNFKHYWLVIKNTTTGKQYFGTATGGDGDVSANHFDLLLTESGTYKVDVYAVNQSGGGKSDSKTFGVGKYGLATPTISLEKSSYTIGETAKISWVASPAESDFKHYWLVIKNTTNGKTYYGTATGGDGDVSANHYDLAITESGVYKVDVYAVDHGGGGKSDSKTFGVGKYEITTPSISFDKSSYIEGETAKITWTASPSESDLKHYWLVIKNTTNGKTYYGTATGGDGDVNANHYDLPLTESGTYKVDVYAVDHGGGGKSDSKTFIVEQYELTTPTITLDKNSYMDGETAKITWEASPAGSKFKHYWLVIKNTTSDKLYYGTATDGDGDVNANHYDLPLTESGTYKVDVYAVGRDGSGKSDSKTFVVSKELFDIGDTNLDGHISISDVTAIQRHLAELAVFDDEQLSVADTNGDGEINIADATHLQMFLAEYDVVLGKT